MRRMFLLILLALLAGVGLIAVIETDPGYVLVAYRNYTVETSLWVGILVLLLFTLVVYFALRLLRRLVGGQASLAGWVDGRRTRAASRLTTRGLISFTEGNWERARRQLLRGAEASEAPLPNYLMAARASYHLGENDRVREYLGAAEAAESEAGIAVELTHAELRLQAGQYEQALATLVRARRNAGRHPHVLDLLHQAYLGLKDWPALVQLLPELKKYKVLGAEECTALERQVYIGLLTDAAVGAADSQGESLRTAWQQVPSALKQDEEVLCRYVEILVREGFHTAADKVIRRVLKQSWSSPLVRQYAAVQLEDPAGQLAHAEHWLQEHHDDAELQLCLGRLSARNKLWGKAREYFENAHELKATPEVCAELGRLLLGLGEPRVAGAYYREGLELSEPGLPQLPLPENTVPLNRRLAEQGRLPGA